jgi:alpha-galactosidase
MIQQILKAAVALLQVSSNPALETSTGIGKLPALGWNSWNTFRCDVNQSIIYDTAKQIVALGLKDAGYQYINIDDCWAAQDRDDSQRLQAHPVKFSDGIGALADYIHNLGMKIGIYSDDGQFTCARVQPGSLGYEDIDAQTFANWGIDCKT